MEGSRTVLQVGEEGQVGAGEGEEGGEAQEEAGGHLSNLVQVNKIRELDHHLLFCQHGLMIDTVCVS